MSVKTNPTKFSSEMSLPKNNIDNEKRIEDLEKKVDLLIAQIRKKIKIEL